MPDVTPEQTQLRNAVRSISNPANISIMWDGVVLHFADVVFDDGLSREPTYRFRDENDTRSIHFDVSQSNFAGVNLENGETARLSPVAVDDGVITLSK